MAVAAAPLRKDPPGPGMLTGWKPLYDSRRDHITPIANVIRQYGDITLCRLGLVRFYFLNHPDFMQEILVSKHKYMHKDVYFQFLGLVLGNGLLTSEGDFHLRQRRMIQPAFHRERIRGYGESMIKCSLALRDSWQDGQALNMGKEMMGLTLAIVAQALFNSDVTQEAKRVQQALDIILPMDMRYLPPLGWLMKRLPLPSNARFKRAVAELDDVLYKIIADHRARGDQGDLLSMLLMAQDEDDGEGMTDKQVRDEALTLFLAGHESTALAITWTWYLLSLHPDVEQKFHEELDTVLGGAQPTPDDYQKLKYTYMVFAESMRLYPPVYINGREAIEDTTIGGYDIPKGSQIIYSSYVTHRDERFFPDPEKFDPERFLPEAVEKRHKFAYIPFGAGRRLCVGEPFAWMEGVLALATLGQHWRAELDPNHVVELDPRITLRPKGGMPMTVHRRR